MPKYAKTILIYIITPLLLLMALPAIAATISSSRSASYFQNTGINRGLVGWWTFDGADTTATTVLDKSGQNNTGTRTGGTSVINGKLGQALKFNGLNSEVDITGIPISIVTTSTISFWMKPKSLPEGTHLLTSYGGADYPTGNLIAQNGAGLYFYWLSGGSSFSAGSLSVNKWSHIIVTSDSGNVIAYQDGVKIGSAAVGTGDPASHTFYIGGRDSGSWNFDGIIDDVRIYSRALSAAEIAQLYTLGGGAKVAQTTQKASYFTGGLKSGLVGHWTFDGADVTATQALDKSGQGNNCTKTALTPTPGTIGQALTFKNASSSKCVTASHILGTPPDYFTLSAWIKPSSAGQTSSLVTGEGSSYANFQLYSGRLGWGLYGVSSWQVGATTIPANKWTFVAMTFSTSTQLVKMYYNGVFDGQKDVTGMVMQGGVNTISGPYSSFFDGSMDDVRVYSRVLSASEIQQLYTLGGGAKVAQTTQKQSQFQGVGINRGLVGWWTFDGADTTATTVLDKSGQNNTGTRSGGTSVTPGKLGQAMKFDGVEDPITITDIAVLTTTQTKSVWVYYKSFPVGGNQYLIDEGGNIQWIQLIDSNNNGIPKISFGFDAGSGANYATGNFEYASGRWHHVVVMSSGLTMSLYVDGVLDKTITADSAAAPGNITIGDYTGSGPYYLVNGLMDDVRIYSRALSAAEVQQLYQMGK